MNGDLLRYLRCPICGQPLAGAGPAPALRCPRGHTHDTARQGYVNLLPGRAGHDGDTVEMVAARYDFLSAGHYDPISTLLAEAASAEAASSDTAPAEAPSGVAEAASTGARPLANPAPPPSPAPPLVVDAGAGTGRHLAAVLDALPHAVGLALDVSKPALRRAARAHPRAGAARCDTWHGLPLADGTATLLLNVFAPRNGAEFHRVLRPDGALLVVTPAADHLTELVERLGLLRVDRAKQDRVSTSLAGRFTEVRAAVHRWEVRLRHSEVRTLVGMGPSAWHTAPARLAEQIAALPEPVRVTAAVRLAVYRPN